MSLATDLEILLVLKEIKDLLKTMAPQPEAPKPFVLPEMDTLRDYLNTTPRLERCTDGGSHRFPHSSVTPYQCCQCGYSPSITIYNADLTPKG